jgi:hypothetical protein
MWASYQGYISLNIKYITGLKSSLDPNTMTRLVWNFSEPIQYELLHLGFLCSAIVSQTCKSSLYGINGQNHIFYPPNCVLLDMFVVFFCVWRIWYACVYVWCLWSSKDSFAPRHESNWFPLRPCGKFTQVPTTWECNLFTHLLMRS